jgi:hypothetical protein
MRILFLAGVVATCAACGIVRDRNGGRVVDAFVTYEAGMLARSGRVAPSGVRQLGCIEIGVVMDPHPRHATSVVTDVYFGNRCDHPTPLHLGRLVVRSGRDPLQLFDPRGEAVLLTIDARAHGRETMRWDSTKQALPDRMCVSFDGVSPDEARERDVCFVREQGRWHAESDT